MARWYGKIGYVNTVETPEGSGVWVETPIEKEYAGDLNRNHKRYEGSNNLNDNITLQNEISIVCDPYAIENFQFIRYAEIMGTMWKVTSVDVQYPRLILSIGGVYNGEQA